MSIFATFPDTKTEYSYRLRGGGCTPYFFMLLFSFIQAGKKGWIFAVVGAVGMCITGRTMELWETAFTGCGKALAFPCAVNAFSISGMVCYAHFHGSIPVPGSSPFLPLGEQIRAGPHSA